MIRFRCPHCGHAMKAPDEAAEKVAACSNCKTHVAIPRESTAERVKANPTPLPQYVEAAAAKPLPNEWPEQPPAKPTPKVERWSGSFRLYVALFILLLLAVGLTIHFGIVNRIKADAATELAEREQAVRAETEAQIMADILRLAELDRVQRGKKQIVALHQVSHWSGIGNAERKKFSIIGGRWRLTWRCDSSAIFNATIKDAEMGDLRAVLSNITENGKGEMIVAKDGHFTIDVECDRGRWEIFAYEQGGD